FTVSGDRAGSDLTPLSGGRTYLDLAVLRDELQRHAVVAPALIGGRRAVVEYVPVVAAAALAVVLGARVDQVEVLLHVERAGDGGEEARPAGAGLEFHLGSKHRQAATGAGVDAGPLLVVERAGAGALGAFLAHHVVGLGRQALLPLLLRKLERLARRGNGGAGWQEVLPVLLQGFDVFHGLGLGVRADSSERERRGRQRE